MAMENVKPNRPMFAMVCVNNVNRSTAAHKLLDSEGLRVCSYGAGCKVTLPGRSLFESHTFKFLTPYSVMHSVLKEENTALFMDNEVLEILERNMPIKKAPERWQSLSNQQIDGINVVVCLDYSMFFTVLTDINERIELGLKVKQLHMICLDIKDTPDDALVGSERVRDLCLELNIPMDELTEEFVNSVVETFEKEHDQKLLYAGFHM